MMIKSVATNHISLNGLEPGYRKLSVNCRKDNSTGEGEKGEEQIGDSQPFELIEHNFFIG